MAGELFESFNRKQMEEYKEETGVDIPSVESLRSDQSPFELRAKAETKEVSGGAIFEQGSIELPDGDFTNFYDLSFEADRHGISPRIHTASQPFSLKRALQNDKSTIGAINAGFFYLADEGAFTPVDPTYHLCIRNGLVVGLPAADRPVAYTSGDVLEAKHVRAQGIIKLGSKEYEWIGARAEHGAEEGEPQVLLYNSACCTIRHVTSNDSGTKRVLDETANFTPLEDGAVDVVVRMDEGGVLRVENIIAGGRVNIFDGNFILHIKGDGVSGIKIGDPVQPLTLDGIQLSDIASAVSIGPSVHHFENHEDHEINHDASLGSHPPFKRRRMARSVLYKDIDGYTHMRIFDGAPKTQHFQGITPRETSILLPQNQMQWAYHLDPGQSSRIVVRDSNDSISTFGNRHYLRWPKKPDHPFLWSPGNGRRVSSAITFYKNANE